MTRIYTTADYTTDDDRIALTVAGIGVVVACFGHPFLGPFIVIFAIAYWNPSP